MLRAALAFTLIAIACSETCVRELKHFSLSGMDPVTQFRVRNARQCVQRCITQTSNCKSVVYYHEKKPVNRRCELYLVDSMSPRVVLVKQKDLNAEMTVIYEILVDCKPQPPTFSPNRGGPIQFDLSGDLMSWSSWTPWSKCTKPCGGGQEFRSRKCMNCPIKQQGIQQQERQCNAHKCDTNAARDLPPFRSQNQYQQNGGSWGQWGYWTQCPNYCPANRYRTRTCNGGNCPGPSEETRPCECTQPEWNNWGPWSPCAATCGSGTRSRGRTCTNPGQCQGQDVESIPCSSGIPCSQWHSWTSWSQCSATCGQGQRTRSRTCSSSSSTINDSGYGNGGGTSGGSCPGQSLQTTSCDSGTCAYWTTWQDWSICTTTCGQGSHTRRRTCSERGRCSGSDTETSSCYRDSCPTWQSWGPWGACGSTCGDGYKTRWRHCSHQNQCVGKDTSSEHCNLVRCPSWNSWGQWGGCSTTCGTGERARTRTCDHGHGCQGASRSTTKCVNEPCPQWSTWYTWTACSATCGGGLRTRERTCLYGTHCPGASSEKNHCDAGACPTWSSWATWSYCSVTCGDGKKSRSRQCQSSTSTNSQHRTTGTGDYGVPHGSSNTPFCPGISTESVNCHKPPCPVWTSWTHWTPCSVTCGQGQQTRNRHCLHGTSGSSCPGDDVIIGFCTLVPCATWTDWTTWGSCSATCGQGQRTRKRSCQGGSGTECPGSYYETGSCDAGCCPFWTVWGQWAGCTSSCGQGTRYRSRQCQACGGGGNGYGSSHGRSSGSGSGCSGDSTQSEPCASAGCPTWRSWSVWTPCSATCGSGSRTRSRSCSSGSQCAGSGYEITSCTLQPCSRPCSWGSWSPWSSCDVACGIGTSQRERPCFGCNQCPGGSPYETKKCERAPCTGGQSGYLFSHFRSRARVRR